MITTKDALTVNGTPKIVTCPNNNQQPHIISQEEAEEEESPLHKNTSPAANTCSQTVTHMITQECILSISEPLATPAATQKNLKLDFAGAIINGNTGAVLEYRHLSKHHNVNKHGNNHLALKLANCHKECQAK